jgi:hypothetical protein
MRMGSEWQRQENQTYRQNLDRLSEQAASAPPRAA